MNRSRKRGHFLQNSHCELDISVDSAKSAIRTCENHLTLAHHVPKLQSFKFHTRAYLGFEISTFIVYFRPVAKRLESPYTTGSRYTCTMFGRLLLQNRQLPMATAVHLVVFVDA